MVRARADAIGIEIDTARSIVWRISMALLAVVALSTCGGRPTDETRPSSRSMAVAAFADPGFASETIAGLGDGTPVGVAFAPDGALFIWEQEGVVWLWRNGQVLGRPFLDVSDHVVAYGDRGLIGLAIDPDFSQNGYVYLLYDYQPPGDPVREGGTTARLTRVEADAGDPDVALVGTETVLLGSETQLPCLPGHDCIPSDNVSHTIGTVRVSSDGTMFVGNGDGADFNRVDELALRAQSLDTYSGKILRVRRDGTAPVDNPFYDGTDSVRSKVWAYGLRNPYRFTIDPATSEPLIGDVGWDSWEELNRGRGANFGWPCYEGPAAQPGYQAAFEFCRALDPETLTPPLHAYDHSAASCIVGGGFDLGTRYPEAYRGNFFFADYTAGTLSRMTFDGDRNPTGVFPFASGIEGPVSLEQGPDGYFYYVSMEWGGQVRRIKYREPIARISANPLFGYSPLVVSFTGTDSFDPSGSPLSFSWDFGDGSVSAEPNPVHTYTADVTTTLMARLTVTNAEGMQATGGVTITLGSVPPVPVIDEPVAGAVAHPGDLLHFAGHADDAEDGSLEANELSWRVLLHHADPSGGNEHTHTLLFQPGTAEGDVMVGSHGEGIFALEFVLFARDRSGLIARTARVTPIAP